MTIIPFDIITDEDQINSDDISLTSRYIINKHPLNSILLIAFYQLHKDIFNCFRFILVPKHQRWQRSLNHLIFLHFVIQRPSNHVIIGKDPRFHVGYILRSRIRLQLGRQLHIIVTNSSVQFSLMTMNHDINHIKGCPISYLFLWGKGCSIILFSCWFQGISNGAISSLDYRSIR